MLSFQIVQIAQGQAIQIYCDEAGITVLVEALRRARETGHVHLWGPSFGSSDLSDKSPFGEPAIGEVIITTGGG